MAPVAVCLSVSQSLQGLQVSAPCFHVRLLVGAYVVDPLRFWHLLSQTEEESTLLHQVLYLSLLRWLFAAPSHLNCPRLRCFTPQISNSHGQDFTVAKYVVTNPCLCLWCSDTRQI